MKDRHRLMLACCALLAGIVAILTLPSCFRERIDPQPYTLQKSELGSFTATFQVPAAGVNGLEWSRRFNGLSGNDLTVVVVPHNQADIEALRKLEVEVSIKDDEGHEVYAAWGVLGKNWSESQGDGSAFYQWRKDVTLTNFRTYTMTVWIDLSDEELAGRGVNVVIRRSWK